ncbi:PTS sugar transporter subunit IIA [Escherichia coli]|nr:PTS sugar transporter subunit IIA [Escherichia coli]
MNVFDKRNIVLNAEPANKQEAINLCGRVLLNNGYVKPLYLDDMISRENIVTTYIGNNVAIPHGLSNSASNIIHSGLSLIQVPNGVEFGTSDDSKIAYIVIGIAGKDDGHMSMLETLAEVLTDMKKIEQLRRATSEVEIFNIFQEVSF